MVGLLRRSVSSLFHTPPRSRPTSVTENLAIRKQCSLTLDGPGITDDKYACPITWSKHNLIAVACGNDAYHQDLDTRLVSHLCTVQVSNAGRLHAIDWAGEGRVNLLALGTTTGVIQVWDAGLGGAGKFLRMWREDTYTGVGGLDWCEDVLAVGSHDGTISLFDVRKKTETKQVPAHKGKVLGIKWSADGSLVASGDDFGVVYVWDKRAGKQLLDEGTHGPKMRHRGPVKVQSLISGIHSQYSPLNRPWLGVPGNLTFLRQGACFPKDKSVSGVPLPPHHPPHLSLLSHSTPLSYPSIGLRTAKNSSAHTDSLSSLRLSPNTHQ